jgi:hypothetical protein
MSVKKLTVIKLSDCNVYDALLSADYSLRSQLDAWASKWITNPPYITHVVASPDGVYGVSSLDDIEPLMPDELDGCIAIIGSFFVD